VMNTALFENAFKILKDVADLVYLKDNQGVYRAVNPKFVEVVGQSPEQIVGKTPFDLFDIQFAKDRLEEDEQAFSEGENIAEVRFDDSIYSIRKTQLKNDNGEVIGIIAIGRDITELKKMQEKSQKAEIIFRLVLDTVPESIFWKDTNSVYLGGNKSFSKACGLGVQDIPGKTDQDMPWKELADIYVADDRKVVQNGEAKVEYEEPYTDIKRQAIGWARTSKVPIVLNGHGTIVGILGTYRDVTEEVEARMELEQYAMELEISNKELEQFAYVASHDLKAPLRNIHIRLDLLGEALAECDGDSEKALGLMDEIHVFATKMTKMVNGLLDLSRLTNKTLDSKIIDLEEIIDDVIQILPNNGLKIVVNELPEIYGDESQIYRLFQNLLENSNKFRDPQKEDNIVCAYICCDGKDEVILCIEDNGIGMPKDPENRAFDIFRCLHSQNEGAGEGLGLAICKKIVESHKGRIWIDSEEGVGMKVFVAFRKLSGIA